MKRKRLVAAISVVLTSVLLLMTMLSGCSRKDVAPEPVEPVSNTDPVEQAEASEPPEAETDPVGKTEPDEPSEAEADTGRQDGERFEAVIILEGMEETIQYEHVRNETAGFELDYDYELLKRQGETNNECFVSRYDAPEDPQNYLEVTYDTEDADTITAAVKAALSDDFDTVVMESYMLDRAGSCVRISASDAKGGKATPGSLQTVYIVPAADGCHVATVHCTVESAEGFGARFSNILNTLTVIDR